MCKLQAQANLLKNLAVTGTTTTTIITVGIGVDISVAELNRLATSPRSSILLPNLGNATVSFPEQQLLNTIFGKKLNRILLMVQASSTSAANCYLMDTLE